MQMGGDGQHNRVTEDVFIIQGNRRNLESQTPLLPIQPIRSNRCKNQISAHLIGGLESTFSGESGKNFKMMVQQ
jgi:hypothetical protein